MALGFCTISSSKEIKRLVQETGVPSSFISFMANTIKSVTEDYNFLPTANEVTAAFDYYTNGEVINSDRIAPITHNGNMENSFVYKINKIKDLNPLGDSNLNLKLHFNDNSSLPLLQKNKTESGNIYRVNSNLQGKDLLSPELFPNLDHEVLRNSGVDFNTISGENLAMLATHYSISMDKENIPNPFVDNIPKKQVAIVQEYLKKAFDSVAEVNRDLYTDPVYNNLTITNKDIIDYNQSVGSYVKVFSNGLSSLVGKSENPNQLKLNTSQESKQDSLNKFSHVYNFLGYNTGFFEYKGNIYFVPLGRNNSDSPTDLIKGLYHLVESLNTSGKQLDISSVSTTSQVSIQSVLNSLSTLAKDTSDTAQRLGNELKNNDGKLSYESSKEDFLILLNHLQNNLQQEFGVDIQSVLDSLYEKANTNENINVENVISDIHQVAKKSNYNPAFDSKVDFFTVFKESKVGAEIQTILDDKANLAKNLDSLSTLFANSRVSTVNATVEMLMPQLKKELDANNDNGFYTKLLFEILKVNPSLLDTIVSRSDIGIEGLDTKNNRHIYGKYNGSRIEIAPFIPKIPKMNISLPNVLFHEIMHVATLEHSNKDLIANTEHFLVQVREAIKQKAIAKYSNKKDKDNYVKNKAERGVKIREELESFYRNPDFMGLHSPQEFYAELFRSPSLARMLYSIDSVEGVTIKKDNIFTKLFELLAKFFKFDSVSRINESALGQGIQLLSDAILINKSEIKNSVKSLSYLKGKKEFLDKVYSKDRIYKSLTNDKNVGNIENIFNSLMAKAVSEKNVPLVQALGQIAKDESKFFGTISKFNKLLSEVAVYSELNDSQTENINFHGVYTKEFMDKFVKWFPNNLESYSKMPFAKDNVLFNKKYEGLLLFKDELVRTTVVRIDGKAMAMIKANESHGKGAYILLDPTNTANFKKLTAMDLAEIVYLRKDTLYKKTEVKGTPLLTPIKGEIDIPLSYRIYNRNEYNKLRDSYDNNDRLVQDRIDMVVDNFINILNTWHNNDPNLSREEIVKQKGIGAMKEALIELYTDEIDLAEDPYIETEYLKILSNLDLLLDSAIGKIESIEGIRFTDFRKKDKVNKKEVPTQESERIEEEMEIIEEEGAERYLLRQDSKSLFDRLSKEVVRELTLLKYPSDSMGAYNDLGMLRTVPLEESKDALLDALKRMNSVEELVPRLTHYLYKYPFLESLIYKLKNDPTLATLFHNSFNLNRVNAIVIKEGTSYPFSLPTNLSDRNTIINSWRETLSTGRLIGASYSVYGENNDINANSFVKAVDKFASEMERFNSLVVDLKAVEASRIPHADKAAEKQNINTEIIQILSDMYKSVGINIPTAEIKALNFAQLKSHSGQYNKMIMVPKKILNVLNSIKNNPDELSSITNISLVQKLGEKENKVYDLLYRRYKTTIDFGGEAVTSQDGTSHYLNRNPSYIGRLIKKINPDPTGIFSSEQRDQFFHDTWGKYEGQYSYTIKGKTRYYGNLLNSLYLNNKNAADELEYHTLLGYNGKQWKDLAPNDVLKMRFTAYIHNGIKYNSAYFMIPTLADSPEIGFLKMQKYQDGKGPKNTAQNLIIDNLYDLYLSERNRVNFVRRQKALQESESKLDRDKVNPDTLIKNYHDNGHKFSRFPFINDLIDPSIPDTQEISLKEADVKEAIKNNLDTRFQKFLEIYQYTVEEDGELVTKIETPSILSQVVENDDGYADQIPSNADTTQEGLEKILKDYFYNDYNASAEIMHILGTDSAFYDNGTDFQKRFKQVYASGQALDTSAMYKSYTYNAENNTYTRKEQAELVGKKFRNTLVVTDIYQESKVSAELLRALEKTFDNIDERIDAAKQLGIYNKATKTVKTDKGITSYSKFLNHKDGTFTYSEGVTEKMYDSLQGEEKFYFGYSTEGPIKSYSEIRKLELTDGQTLLSMDEFRAIAIMAGKHTQEMERSFVKYKTTGNVNEFNTELSNIKSFYYGDESIETGDENMPFIKNNVQFKHAESVVMMYKMVQNSPFLSAISEFLNEGFFNGNKTHNIDAISFGSVQKVGGRNQASLDINGSKESILASLRKLADVENRQKGKSYIQTNYDNYVIQQPTNNHIVDNVDQSVGTQIRNINISDIPDNYIFNINGKELTKGEYVKVFNTLVNKKIQTEFKKLAERFTDNEKLSELFIETIDSNNRYSNNLKEYFTLKNGEFEVPMFSPQNSILVHQMIMSIIGKNIVKHKIRGGKVINNSNIGYSEDLKIQFENDTISYFEVAMPFYGTLEEYNSMLDSEGNFDMSRVDPKLLTSVFYRIPTEKHYSVYPVKVKYFLPPSQGVNIIFPSEISALSGLDFDIDAMYGFLYDYIMQDSENNIRMVATPSSNIDNILNSADEYLLATSVVKQVNKDLEAAVNDVHMLPEDVLKQLEYEFSNTDEYSEISPKGDLKKSPFKSFRLFTGNSIGNTPWREIGLKYGLGKYSSYSSVTMKNIQTARPDLINEIEDGYEDARRELDEDFFSPDSFKGKVYRSYYLQIRASDGVFIVGNIEQLNGVGKDILKGDIKYAAQMAINTGKPLFVYDQENKSWKAWENNEFVDIDTPSLTPMFTGLGADNINSSGIDAIINVYDKSFNEMYDENQISEDALISEGGYQEASNANEGLQEIDMEESSKAADDNLFIDMLIQNMISQNSSRFRLKGSNFDNLVELGSEKKLRQMGQYSDEQIEKMSAREKEQIVNDIQYDLNDPSTHEYFMSTNRNSAGNIGIFANSASFHNKMTSIQSATVVPSKGDPNSKGKLGVIKALLGLGKNDALSISNIEMMDAQGNSKFISELQAEDITASVDGAKRPSHSLMGVNRSNINAYTVFTMVGMDRRAVMDIMDFTSYDFASVVSEEEAQKIKIGKKRMEPEFHYLSREVALLLPQNLYQYSPEALVDYLMEIDAKGLNGDLQYKDFIAKITKDSKADRATLIQALMFIGRSIADFSDSVTKNVLQTRYDSNNSRPKESISYMMKAIFDRKATFYGIDSAFRINYSDDFAYNSSNQFFEYAYSEMLRVLKNKLNIQAQGRIYDQVPHFNPKQSERLVRHSYTNYMLENIQIPGYGPIDNKFMTIFPNYAATEIIKNDKLRKLSFFQSLSIVKNNLVILKDTVIHKDTFISDWDSAYRDSETKELALSLALYAIYQDGFEFGSNKMGYFIPPSIMKDIDVLTDIAKTPDLLYEYINLELLSQPFSISGFKIQDSYLKNRFEKIGLKYVPNKINTIKDIPSSIMEEIIVNYTKYTSGRKVHEKAISFEIGPYMNRKYINALIIKDSSGKAILQDLTMLEEELKIQSLSNKKANLKMDMARTSRSYKDSDVDGIFEVSRAEQLEIDTAKESDPTTLNEKYVEEVIFGSQGFKDLVKLPTIERNIKILGETIKEEFDSATQRGQESTFTNLDISEMSSKLLSSEESFSRLIENLTENNTKEFIDELLRDIENCY